MQFQNIGIEKEAVRNDRKKYRNIFIYIMKKYTGMTNVQIGQNFNDLSYSAVSKAYQRVAKAVEEKKAMRKDVKKIISILSQCKG